MEANYSSRNNDIDGSWIGIDLGTSNSGAAVWDGVRGHPKWMRLPGGLSRPGSGSASGNSGKDGRLVPSVLLFVHSSAISTLDADDGFAIAKDEHAFLQEHVVEELTGIPDVAVFTGYAAQRRVQTWEEASSTSSGCCKYSASDVCAAYVTDWKHLLLLATAAAASKIDTIDCEVSGKESLSNRSRDRDEQGRVGIRPLGAPNRSSSSSTTAVWLHPWQLAALLLRSLRLAAASYLKGPARRKGLRIPRGGPSFSSSSSSSSSPEPAACVVGVPAGTGQMYRQQIRSAGHAAGFSRVETVVESTAAVLTYGLAVAGSEERVILVMDMGGGTNDLTICRMKPSQNNTDNNNEEEDGTDRRFRVVVTRGDIDSGGNAMDAALMTRVLEKWSALFTQEQTRELRILGALELHERSRLLKMCQQAKEKLCGNMDSDSESSHDYVDIAIQGQNVRITMEDLDQSIAPVLERTRLLVNKTLQQYASVENIDSSTVSVDEVILIGGATRVPSVRNLLRGIFPPPPDLCLSTHPMAAVAMGCAVQAAFVSCMVPTHELKSALMLDCLPYAIGVLVQDSVFVEVLSRNATLPAKGVATFQLACRDQPGVTVRAVEDTSSDNNAAEDGNSYVPVGEFTFLLHRLTAQQKQNVSVRSVKICMTMKEDGAFEVAIFDEYDPEHIRARQQIQAASKDGAGKEHLLGYSIATNPERSSDREVLLLSAVLFLLLVLYIAAKVLFAADLRILEEL